MALCDEVALAFKSVTEPHDADAPVNLEAAIKREANIWKTKVHPAASRTKDASLLLQIAQSCGHLRHEICQFQNCDQSVARALIQILLVREGDIMRYRERLLSGADKRQAPGVWYWQAHAAGRHGLALHKLGYTEAAKQQLASAAAFYSLSLWRRESCLASHASLRQVVRTACLALGQAETLAQSKQPDSQPKDPLAGPNWVQQPPAPLSSAAGCKRKRPIGAPNSKGGARAATATATGTGLDPSHATADGPVQALQPHRAWQTHRKQRTASSARAVARQARLVRRLESTGSAQLRSERSTAGRSHGGSAATRPAGALHDESPEPVNVNAASAQVKSGVARRTMWKLLQLRMLQMVASAAGQACNSEDDRAIARNGSRAATGRRMPTKPKPKPQPQPQPAASQLSCSPHTHGSSRDGGAWAPSRGMLLQSRVTRDFRRLLDAGWMQPGQALTILLLLLGHGLCKQQWLAGSSSRTTQPAADSSRRGGGGSAARQQTGLGAPPPPEESAGTQNMRNMLLRTWILLASRVTAHSRAALLHIRPRDVLEASAEAGASSEQGLNCEQGLHGASEPKAKRARTETRTADSMGVLAQAIGPFQTRSRAGPSTPHEGNGAVAVAGAGAGVVAVAGVRFSASRASGQERLEAACKWMAVARVCAECALRHGPVLRLALAGAMDAPSRGRWNQAHAGTQALARTAVPAATGVGRRGAERSGRGRAQGSKGSKGRRGSSHSFKMSPSKKPIPPRMRTHRDLLGALLREVAALCKAVGSRTWLDVGQAVRGTGRAANESSAAASSAPSSGRASYIAAGWNRPVLEEDVLLWDVSWMQQHGNGGRSPAASTPSDQSSSPAPAPKSTTVSEPAKRDIGIASLLSEAAASGCWRPTLGCRPPLRVDLEGCPRWVREGQSPLDRLRLHGQSGDGQSGWDALEGLNDLRVRAWQLLRCGEVLYRECQQGGEQGQALAGATAIEAPGR